MPTIERPTNRITTTLEFETISPTHAQVWIVITLDGETSRSLFISGPYWPVLTYFEGRITLKEYRERLEGMKHIPAQPPAST